MALRPAGGTSARVTERRTIMIKRILFFAYGVAGYVVFLATFLYAIGFIGGFARADAPRRPGRGPLATALADRLRAARPRSRSSTA